MARPLPRLRRVEQLRRGAPGGGAAAGQGPPRPAAARADGLAPEAVRLDRQLRGRARPIGHRRVRPRAGRRHRAGLAGADRRRAGDRQEHAAAAGGAPARAHARERALRLGRGVGAPDQAARRAARDRRRRALRDGRDLARAHPRGGREPQAARARDRLGADGLLVALPVGPRQHQPGARGGDAAAVRGQGPRHHDVPDRPRHQGRQPGGTQVARAHRGHRALLRGREAPAPPHRARGEEPLRRGLRARASSR